MCVGNSQGSGCISGVAAISRSEISRHGGTYGGFHRSGDENVVDGGGRAEQGRPIIARWIRASAFASEADGRATASASECAFVPLGGIAHSGGG